VKKIYKSIRPLCLFVALLSLASCQKDDILPELTKQGENDRTQASDLIATMPTFYRLIQLDQRTLTYDTKGRLLTAVDDEENWSFTYGYHLITKKRSNNMEKVDYFLDGSGRCTKAVRSLVGVPYNLANTTIYEYNTLGKLSRRYTLDAPTRSIDFAYNRMGDLISITYFNADRTISAIHSYFYQLSAIDPLLPNTYPLNPESDEFLDANLPIYGKFYNHFFKRILREDTYDFPYILVARSDTRFQYTLNSDGVPTYRKVFLYGNPTPIHTNVYNYQVTMLQIL
jgi:hypothetical protein